MTNDTKQLWNAFHRALLEHVAAAEGLRVLSQREEVVEIALGKHQLLVSLDGGSIKARMKFQGPDRDRPNMIRVMFLPADPQPYEIGGDTFPRSMRCDTSSRPS
jgi:hypothetical protein